MLPYSVYEVVRAIHEDRIRDAQRPVPEWIDIPAPRQRRPGTDRLSRHVRSSFADALRRLAARVDPQGSTANA